MITAAINRQSSTTVVFDVLVDSEVAEFHSKKEWLSSVGGRTVVTVPLASGDVQVELELSSEDKTTIAGFSR